MPYTDLLRVSVFITAAEATQAVGAGYALIVSLAWHTREAAVLGIEHRDGVKFYVVPSHALRPIELVRAPGLRGDRLPV